MNKGSTGLMDVQGPSAASRRWEDGSTAHLVQLRAGSEGGGVGPGHGSQRLRLLPASRLQVLMSSQHGVWKVPVQVLVPPAHIMQYPRMTLYSYDICWCSQALMWQLIVHVNLHRHKTKGKGSQCWLPFHKAIHALMAWGAQRQSSASCIYALNI